MSKVFISTRYCKTGKPVGGGFTKYISTRDRVDKTINTRYRSDVFTQYAAERPGVVKMGEHGLFGQEDYVSLHKASQEIYHHKGIVWEEIYLLGKLMLKGSDMIRRRHGEIFLCQSNLRLHPTTEFLLRI